MKQKKTRRFPWALALFLCLYVTVTALAVTALSHRRGVSAPSPDSTQTLPTGPDHEAVFRQLFSQPDWQQLYTQAGETDGKFEGKDAYAAYMNAKVGDKALTCFEVRTDLADTHRYVVYLEDEKIAAFTMSGEPDWKLDTIELYYEATGSAMVEILPGYTVFVNGVELDDSYTIRTMETKAEAYLPEGLHGLRRQWQQVTGLLAEPQITVQDENGEPVTVERDEETGIYQATGPAAPEITEEQAELARKAAIADGQYTIGVISKTQLAKYFDDKSALYKLLISNNRNIQGHKGSSIDESTMEVGEFCRYSDTLYSVNVKLTQNIVRLDGTLRVYTADKTYFFTERDGRYRVTDYTNEHMTEAVEQVRLRFMAEEGAISQMVGTTDAAVTAPEITAPAGEQLVGWATKTVSEDAVTMMVRILPDGTVLGELEPMELYPVFEKINNP